MRKIGSLLICIFFSTSLINAQTLTWGPEVGASYNTFVSNNSNQQFDYKFGLKAGMNINFPVGYEQLLNAGLFYQQRGAKQHYALGGVQYLQDYDLNYILLPLNYTYRFRVNYGRSGYVFVTGGPYFAFAFGGSQKLYNNTAETLVKISDTSMDWSQYNPFDFGLMLSARYEFASGLFFKLAYNYSLSSMSKNHSSTIHHQSFIFSSGINFWTWIK